MRTKLSILILLGIFIFPVMACANNDVPKIRTHKQIKIPFFKKRRLKNEHNKWIAAGLDLSLGMFGVHRLYLGTEAHVPVMYTLTLGGGGMLVLVDLGLILLSKDIETYANSSHIFMWRKEG
jgi:TM2 domain-containing membrane protein YozV